MNLFYWGLLGILAVLAGSLPPMIIGYLERTANHRDHLQRMADSRRAHEDRMAAARRAHEDRMDRIRNG